MSASATAATCCSPGTVATYGRGRAVVVATGMATEVGRIAGLLEAAEKEPTPLQQELDRTGKRLSIIMLGICAVVFATGLLSSPVFTLNAMLSLFLFAVALAVAAIPEALPAIVTVGLSLGVRRMAAANAIVRKLPAVETLGAATVICSDKTGTLTRNEMTVRAIFTAGALVEVGGSGYIPEGEFTVEGEPLAEALAASRRRRANAARGGARQRRGARQQRGALARAGRPDRRRADRRGAQVRRGRSRAGALPSHRGNPLHLRAQAPHHRPSRSRKPRRAARLRQGRARGPAREAAAHLWEDGKAVPLGEDRRADLSRRNDALAGQALRTLAIATRTVPAAALGIDPQAAAADRASTIELPDSIEDDLVLLGLVGMIDPPRAEAKAAVATAKRAHIRSVMITGDHPATAEAIARELDIFEPGARLVTGAELRTMDDAELDAIVEHVRVFARVDPEHKLRIVGALQRKGHIVAMTGDGINDAPALKTANIGVAMGITGTDVSKEAADMVLTDDNFASIVKAIEEGRGIYDNIRKYLIYLLVVERRRAADDVRGRDVCRRARPHLGGARAVPAAARRAAPLDQPDHRRAAGAGARHRPEGPRRHGAASRAAAAPACSRRRTGGASPASALVMMVGTLAVLDAYYPGGLFTLFAKGTAPNVADETYARTMAFTTLMMFQLFNVFNCRSTWRSAFSGFFENKWLLAAVAVLAVHARARDLCPVPADGVPHGAAVGDRLAGRDGRRGALLIAWSWSNWCCARRLRTASSVAIGRDEIGAQTAETWRTSCLSLR